MASRDAWTLPEPELSLRVGVYGHFARWSGPRCSTARTLASGYWKDEGAESTNPIVRR